MNHCVSGVVSDTNLVGAAKRTVQSSRPLPNSIHDGHNERALMQSKRLLGHNKLYGKIFSKSVSVAVTVNAL